LLLFINVIVGSSEFQVPSCHVVRQTHFQSSVKGGKTINVKTGKTPKTKKFQISNSEMEDFGEESNVQNTSPSMETKSKLTELKTSVDSPDSKRL
jgi:hypothetical protein